ncbi:unnamed protein product [Vitrella brassicaformis CCMP3155]|uniref:Methyltransferase domain-containing protein n=1 Tax=Vitrella brassicaformis (strain CCMP3155) TaxID=1169540 RepID=A0A0G4EJ57_VITBC|nr:unnamed protein product [Vitrella brassicaformis CCMP3155]|eukprot:CEL96207.1 unnamed protein product [Vitrella brassicaformis CCMP3155]
MVLPLLFRIFKRGRFWLRTPVAYATGLCGYGLQWNGALIGNINMGFDFTLSSRITERLLQEGCRSVIDFGCGTADMIKELNYRGVHVLGLDANPKTPNMSQDFGDVVDLTHPFKISDEQIRKLGGMKAADWGLCINVAEFVPPSDENVFLANLDAYCMRGIIMAWPKRGTLWFAGTFNERDPQEVVDIMEQRGFIYDPEFSESLKDGTLPGWEGVHGEHMYVFRRLTQEQRLLLTRSKVAQRMHQERVERGSFINRTKRKLASIFIPARRRESKSWRADLQFIRLEEYQQELEMIQAGSTDKRPLLPQPQPQSQPGPPPPPTPTQQPGERRVITREGRKKAQTDADGEGPPQADASHAAAPDPLSPRAILASLVGSISSVGGAPQGGVQGGGRG